MESAKSGRIRKIPAMGWILLLAALLRFFRLGRQSYWADEVTSIWEVDGLHGSILGNLTHSIHGPLHFALLALWGRLGGFGEAWTRSLSALTGLAGVWLIYRLARRLATERTALLSALLLAVSPFHVWYSQEVRNYAQLITLSILSMILLLRILDRGGPLNWIAYFLTAAAALLSNLAAVFLIAAQGLYLLLRKPRLALRILLVLLAVSLLLLPWIRNFDIGWRPELVGRAGAVRHTNFHPLFLPYTLSVYAVGDTVGPTRDQMNRGLSLEMFLPWLPYFALAGAVFGLLFLFGLGSRRGRPEGPWFYLIWLLLPMIATALLARLNVKAYNVRYVSVGYPAFLILVASGIESMRGRWRRAALVLSLLCILVSLKNLYFTPRYWKPDARAAASALAERARDGDLLLVYSIEEPMRYYYKGAGQLRGLDWATPRDEIFSRYMDDFEAHFERVWLVDYRGWYADPEELTKKVFARRWNKVETLSFPGIDVGLYLNRKTPGDAGDES